MGSAENFELVKELASVLGGVVGATRPPIEDGWISRAHQVGQSGKIVAPQALHCMRYFRGGPAYIRNDGVKLYCGNQ